MRLVAASPLYMNFTSERLDLSLNAKNKKAFGPYSNIIAALNENVVNGFFKAIT